MIAHSEIPRVIHRLLAKATLDESGCLLWAGKIGKRGYGVMQVKKMMYVHRLSHFVFKGFIDGTVVRHRCDKPACINPDHLECGTQADNLRDMRIRNRHPGRNGYRIQKDTHDKMLDLIEQGYNRRQIARMLGVNYQTLIAFTNGPRFERWLATNQEKK